MAFTPPPDKIMFEIFKDVSRNGNYQVIYFTELDDHNRETGAHVGFYGLDVHSLWDSLRAVLGYLTDQQPEGSMPPVTRSAASSHTAKTRLRGSGRPRPASLLYSHCGDPKPNRSLIFELGSNRWQRPGRGRPEPRNQKNPRESPKSAFIRVSFAFAFSHKTKRTNKGNRIQPADIERKLQPYTA